MSNILVSQEDQHYLEHDLFINGMGYVVLLKYGDKRLQYLHRLVAASMGELSANMCVDHINNNKLDNRRENIRICTRQQNNCNRASKRALKGVYALHNGQYKSIIYSNNIRYVLGIYSTLTEAVSAYNEAAERLHGIYARVNTYPCTRSSIAASAHNSTDLVVGTDI